MNDVTVIITVLNESHTIDSLLVALMRQTRLPDEVIIVDGGSRDNTFEKSVSFGKQHPELHIKVLQKKGNRSIGRNTAIRIAHTQLIAVTDAGCIPHSTWIEKLLEKKIATELFVVAGYYDAQPANAFEEAMVPYVLVMPDRVDSDNFLPATRSMLITKKSWEKVGGFDETLSDNEDYAFAHSLKKSNISIVFTADAKVTWTPRQNLRQFAWMIFRFARGDTFSGIVRPKVVFLFGRYAFFFITACMTVYLRGILLACIYTGVSLGIYVVWSLLKNYRYTPRGWYWLPLLQITADIAVMTGSLSGLVQ